MTHNWKFPPDYYQHSQEMLETALDVIPAYRSWRVFDPGKNYPLDARYQVMPALTKKDIRQFFPEGLLPPGKNIQNGLESGAISFVNTSGTTDDKVTNIWNQKWWDASEKASWKLNAHAARLATGSHPEAILVNPLNVGIASDTVDLPLAERRLARFLYMSERTSYSTWTNQHMDRMIRELAIFQPVILEANPSLLAKLCRYIDESKQKVFQPGLIVLTYENPTNFHYREIRRVFNCPTASSYGTTETGYVFMQCEDGKFHQNTEFCRVDFQPLKKEHGGPLLGRILVTPFHNEWYHLVRFDVGDLVRLDETDKCGCGRDIGMIVSATEGRFANVTLTCSGKLVSSRELDNNLSVLDGIDEYKLEQTKPDSYELHIASREQDKQKLGETAVAILKGLYGSAANITILHERIIAPEVSGKYRISKTLFPLKIEDYLEENPLNTQR
jgi:phenylacetate-coenzyme A ligase PaaK-like adenylate-forming protein